MALFTYLIAFGHFSSELLLFRSAKINPGVLSPVIVACELHQNLHLSLITSILPFGSWTLTVYFPSNFPHMDARSIRLLRSPIVHTRLVPDTKLAHLYCEI